MSAVNIDLKNFHQEVMNSDKPVLLDFYAPWCGPCQLVSPVLEEIAAENPHIKVGKINVDTEPTLAKRFRTYSIPTLVVMKNGRITQQVVGARSKEQILALM